MKCKIKLRSRNELENVWYNIKEGIAATIFGVVLFVVGGWLVLGLPAGLSYSVQGVTDDFHWSLYYAAIIDAFLIASGTIWYVGSLFLKCEEPE